MLDYAFYALMLTMNGKHKKTGTNRKTTAPPQRRRGLTLSPLSLTLVLLINLIIVASLGWMAFQGRMGVSSAAPIIPETETIFDLAATETPIPSSPAQLEPETIIITATPQADPDNPLEGLMVLALSEYGYTHLFAYHPVHVPLTRLTYGAYDDIHPAISPDGSQIAFASQRNQFWDIYILDLSSGGIIQVTEDTNYNGRPTWSPDGQWLAYEKYANDGNLQIFIKPVDSSLEEILLTTYSGVDYAPAWSPDGRKIAYTSNQSGAHDIWIADLDISGPERFSNMTRNPKINQRNPAWSPDGRSIAWVSEKDGYPQVFVSAIDRDPFEGKNVGGGTLPVWGPAGNAILSAIQTENEVYLTVFSTENKQVLLPPLPLDTRLAGLSWALSNLPAPLPFEINAYTHITPSAPLNGRATPDLSSAFGRQFTIEVANVKAPFPELSALAVEPFYTLRDQAETMLGWDLLSDLENAFVPITETLPPGRSEDWLYTGRAFALNQSLMEIGWIVAVREDIAGQTYWRIYVKPRRQDGSLGRPMTEATWNFNARYSSNTIFYEAGGTQMPGPPQGYWVDFSALAMEYNWERLPALSTWRTFYDAARYNQFAITSGLTWEEAMLQLYPAEIFADLTSR